MNIENSKGTLESLLLKVKEQNDRSADFLASTDNLQKRTNYDEGKPQIVIEAAGGEPTRILDVNDHAYGGDHFSGNGRNYHDLTSRQWIGPQNK